MFPGRVPTESINEEICHEIRSKRKINSRSSLLRKTSWSRLIEQFLQLGLRDFSHPQSRVAEVVRLQFSAVPVPKSHDYGYVAFFTTKRLLLSGGRRPRFARFLALKVAAS